VALTDHYALIIDQITGDSIRRYDWYFHAEGKIDSITPSLTESAFDAFKGNDLDVLFYKEPGLQAAVSSMPTGQGDKYIPLLNLQQTGTNATFIAVISPTNEKCRVYAMKTSDSSYFVYVVYDDAINDVIEIDKSIIYRLLYGKPADLTFTY